MTTILPEPDRSASSSPPVAARASARFGVLELAYAGAVVQTALYNPVVLSTGDLEVYLNTVVWPIVAAGAVVRCARVDDPWLKRALKAVLATTVAVLWVFVMQIGFGPEQPYATANLLRLLYVPLGIVAALAVYRSGDRLLDVSVVAVAAKCIIAIAPLMKGPLDLAHRLTIAELGGHNTFAAFVVFLVVARGSTWVLKGRRPGPLVMTSLAVCVASIFLTFSRGAFLALAAGVSVLLVMAVARSARPGRAVKAGLLLAMVMAPVLVVEPIQSRLSPGSLSQSSGRDEIWEPAWRGFVDRPLTGNGFGSFEAYSSAIVDLTDPTVVGGVTYSAHSLPLQVLYEGGLAGILVIGLAAGLVVWRCWSVVLGPVVVAFIVDSFFETFPHVVQLSWVFGLVLAVSLLYRSETRRPRVGRHWP